MNKSAIVFGASRGLGLNISKKFIEEGWGVTLAARSIQSTFSNSEKYEHFISSNKINILNADVKDEELVREVFENHLKKFGNLSAVINTAAIYGPIGPIETLQIEEVKRCLEVNLIGMFNTIKFSKQIFLAQKYGSFIGLSGGGATSALPNFTPYAMGKVAIVRLIESVANEISSPNIHFNAVAPGVLNTDLLDEAVSKGPEIIGETFFKRLISQRLNSEHNMSRSVDLIYSLSANLFQGITGRLLSAPWDDWEKLLDPKYCENLSDSDFRLRRIEIK